MDAKTEVIRHGDLLFFSVAELPEHAKQREGAVIQEGEATGHAHRLATSEGAAIFENKINWRDTDIYVRVGVAPVEVIHEEHKPVMLPANTTFKVNRAREFDYLEDAARFVAD